MRLEKLKKKEIEELFEDGNPHRTKFITAVTRKADSVKWVIVVSKKHGNAVARNRIRRRLSEAILQSTEQKLPKLHIAIIPRAGIEGISFEKLVLEVNEALGKVGNVG